MNNKAIAYCRCSTDMQEMSIPDQKKSFVEYADKNSLSVIHWFEDEGKSGRYAEERPSLMRMIDYVKTHDDFKHENGTDGVRRKHY
ncbi:MAG: recombinase family protein [Candidatus Omnitrophica bacterium]|nr:recombinase family protein [Candidatus Omnitrophota bacterium]